jgi:transcriptional regulator with XRE-family HTH domain
MLGLSRDDVSAKSGLSPDTLLRMECGSEGITLVELDAVARALGVTSADLVRRGKKRTGRSAETAKPSAGRRAR